MSVNNVTSSTGVGRSGWRSTVHQAHEDFERLFQSMRAGDVSGAQQAYAALQQLADNAPLPNSPPPAADAAAAAAGMVNPVAADWTALGQALQSGSTTAAQDAFTQLEQDLQAAVKNAGHHHHHRQAVGAAQTANAVAQTGAADGSGNAQSAVGSDLKALKQALAAGDTSSAKDLLTRLERDLQASGQSANFPHRLPHGGFGVQPGAAAYATAGTAAARL